MGPEPASVPALPQTDLQVWPTRTVYTFEGGGALVEMTFMTPALPDDLAVYSRPLTYLTWSIASVSAEIHEGLRLVWNNPTLLALAWVAALWQILHHMQIAVLILFATRDLGLSAGAIGLTYAFGGMGCVLASAFAQRLSTRFGVGPIIVHGLALTALGWQAFGLISGPVWLATLFLGCAMLIFDFGAVLYGINYLALRQAITPDRLLGRMTATMRFLTVAAAPLGSLAGGALATAIGLRATLLAIGVLALVLVAVAVVWSPVRRHRKMPSISSD